MKNDPTCFCIWWHYSLSCSFTCKRDFKYLPLKMITCIQLHWDANAKMCMLGSWQQCHASVLIYVVYCVSQLSLMQASSRVCLFGLKAMLDHLTLLKHHCFHDSLCVARLTLSSMKYGCSFPMYQQNTPALTDTTMLYFSVHILHGVQV